MKESFILEKMGPLWNRLLKGDFRRMVILEVLEEGEIKEEGRSHSFYNKVREILQEDVPSFESGPSLQELQRKVSLLCRENIHIFFELLLRWKHLHWDLWERVRDYYFSDSATLKGLSFGNVKEGQDLCLRMAERFAESYPQFESKEILLMTTLFLLELNKQKKRELTAPLTDENLQQFLDEISLFSPFHPAWRELDTFISNLEQLFAAKEALGKQKIRELGYSLKDLVERSKDLLDYFEIKNMASWQIEDVQREKMDETYKTFFQLKSIFHSYSLILQEKPGNLLERKEKDGRLLALEREIERSYTLLFCNFQKQPKEEPPVQRISPSALLDKGEGMGEGRKAIYTLVEKDDLPGAYWLAVSLDLDKKGRSSDALLLKAVLGSWWFPYRMGVFYNELQEIFQEIRTLREPFEKLMTFAATIVPAFFAPGLVEEDFFIDSFGLPVLEEVASWIRDFVERGTILRLEDLPGSQDEPDREEKKVDLAQKAKKFLQHKGDRGLSYHSFLVLNQLLKPGMDLYLILKMVAEDNREEFQRMRPLLRAWEGREAIGERLAPYRYGEVGQDLIRQIQRVLALASDWYYLNYQDEKIREEDGYFRSLEEFSNYFILKSNSLFSGIGALMEEDMRPDVRGGLRCVRSSFEELIGIFNPNQRKKRDSSWWVKGSVSLEESLSRRLFWVPTLTFQNQGIPSPSIHKELKELIPKSTATRQALFSTIPLWREKRDYRFMRDILDAFPNEEKKELLEEIQKERKENQEKILLLAQTTEEMVEKAYQGGVIPEGERYYLLSRLDFPKEILNFQPVVERLEEVQTTVKEALERGLKEREKSWENLQARFKEGKIIPSLEEMKKAFKKEDLLTIDRYLKAYEMYLEEGTGLYFPENLYLQSFMRQVHGIERYAISDSRFRLLLRALQKGFTWGNIKFSRLSVSQREEIEKTLKAYLLLKKRRFPRGETLYSSLEAILSFIGFRFPEEREEKFQILDEGEEHLHLQLKMVAGRGASPFPQFGSLSENTYQLICLQDKPGSDALGNLIHSYQVSGSGLLLILYFGRLTGYQRHQLLKANRERQVVAAVLDELLFLHVLGKSKERLETFFHCSQPFSATIPYHPFLEEKIPCELFYGRNEEISQILKNTGITLLCGGVKTGKSALLYQIQDTFQDLQKRQYALTVDLRGKKPENIWQIIKDFLGPFGLSRRGTPGDLLSQLLGFLDEDNQRRVLFMFDNADFFLTSDCLEKNPILTKLSQIIEASNGRLKVVFSGNKGLFPYLHQSSLPLIPLVLGSLEVGLAGELMEKPLESLGFVLDEKARQFILSKTDSNPYLLQAFGFYLLKNLYRHHDRFRNLRNGCIPVGMDDVMRVFPKVFDLLGERLEKTMALHPHYEVLLMGMVADMKFNGKTHHSSYSPQGIMDLLSCIWPKEMDLLGEEGVESLLMELSILDILTPVAGEMYSFRYGDAIPQLLGENLHERMKGYAMNNKTFP